MSKIYFNTYGEALKYNKDNKSNSIIFSSEDNSGNIIYYINNDKLKCNKLNEDCKIEIKKEEQSEIKNESEVNSDIASNSNNENAELVSEIVSSKKKSRNK